MPKKPSGNLSNQGLNESLIERLENAFNQIDSKKNGKIPVTQLLKLLAIAKEEEYDQDDINEVLDKMEKANDDTITFDELIDFYKELNNPDSIIEAFNLFDANNNGYISTDEFRYILKSVDSHLSEKDIQDIFNFADVSKDGRIDYKEFVSYWNTQ